MKRGIVTHVGINTRGNYYGFIRPDDGGYDVYFNHFGGHGKFSIAGITPEASMHWTDLDTDIVKTSDFPAAGDVLYYAEQSSRADMQDGAWIWCSTKVYQQLEAKIFERCVPIGERGLWQQLEESIAQYRKAVEGGNPIIIQTTLEMVMVFAKLLKTRPIDADYFNNRLIEIMDLV